MRGARPGDIGRHADTRRMPSAGPGTALRPRSSSPRRPVRPRSCTARGPESGSVEGATMLDEPPVAQMLEVAASTAPLLDRAQALVESLDRWLPVEAMWLAVSDPDSNVCATVGSAGLERSVLDYLDRPSVAREIQLAELNVNRPPVSVRELPVPRDELPTWAECLVPAGFRDGLGVPLCEPGGPY